MYTHTSKYTDMELVFLYCGRCYFDRPVTFDSVKLARPNTNTPISLIYVEVRIFNKKFTKPTDVK